MIALATLTTTIFDIAETADSRSENLEELTRQNGFDQPPGMDAESGAIAAVGTGLR